MIPAYKISPDSLMEVVYAISEVGPNATKEEIQEFTEERERVVRECIKVGKELSLIDGEDEYSVPEMYSTKITEVDPSDRDVVLNTALIQYRPLHSFLSYINKGYPKESAAKKTNTLHDIANDSQYVSDYFVSLGKYAGLIETENGEVDISLERTEIPVESTETVESLRNAVDSEMQVILYLEDILGEETTAELDEGIIEDLKTSFVDHAERPRDSLSASGRALEDYFRDIAKKYGSNSQDYEDAKGVGDLAGRMKGDNLISGNHNKRAASIASLRNKSGGHGKDETTNERWRVSPEVSLHAAIGTTLLIRSVDSYVKDEYQML